MSRNNICKKYVLSKCTLKFENSFLPNSVAYVSRSGGMSNELNNIISLNTNGVYEGIAIGGDRYPGTTFMDHILRYQDDPNVKMIILLGEVRLLVY